MLLRRPELSASATIMSVTSSRVLNTTNHGQPPGIGRLELIGWSREVHSEDEVSIASSHYGEFPIAASPSTPRIASV
jgi:hypothetical protein